MIETVRQRQQNAVDFKSCYENLCALQGSCPLSVVTANLGDETVDCNADRIPLQDWNPILNATRINKHLKVIALRSYWQEKVNNGQSGKCICRNSQVQSQVHHPVDIVASVIAVYMKDRL